MTEHIVIDGTAYDTLAKLTERAGYRSRASTIRECLRVMKALHDQADLGFTQIFVRDIKNNTEKVMALPLFQSERDEWQIEVRQSLTPNVGPNASPA